jgi:predicted permease
VETSRIPTGFERKPMLLLDINPGLAGYSREQTQLLLEDLRGRLESLPGAERVSYAMRAPLSPSGGGAAVEVSFPAVELAAQEPGLKIKYNSVGPRYFTTMGTRILRGRAFEAQDGKAAEPVVLINQTMALRFWPEDDPIGEGIRVGDVNWQIVGVVEDAKINYLRERPEPYLYFPMAQRPRSEVTVLVETALEPAALVDPVSATVRSIAPGVPILRLTTQDEMMHFALYDEHMYARLASTLGLLGLCLAATGLFGVISYLVRQRRHEIGIRLALGAQSRDVLMNFVKRGLTLSAVGIALGSSVSLFAADLLAPFLQGVSPRDPLSFLAAAGVVSLTAVLASYLPARRAAQVDPMEALRYE